ncbi:MAG: CoA transferase [Synergistaceae bacterium]|jgi:formyl-CoA transferase|nr:CoA transferase [Synergistaceae bacterium]
MKEGLLSGIRVLDFTQFLAGPYCGQYLADLGAEVIKIENLRTKGDFNRSTPPFQGDISAYFCTMNRNKKGVSIDLKSEKGKAVFADLVKSADVLLENNRPGVMARLGFGYEECKALNVKLIYASVSGFGQYGPYAPRPGYDLIAQAMSGSMSITGWPEDPPTRAGIPLGDVLAGLNAAIGIVASLYKRRETGKGQQIDVSLLDSMISSQQSLLPTYTYSGKLPVKTGNRYLAAAPYDSFMAKDTYFVLACGTDPHFQILCETIGKPEMLEDSRFDTMEKRRANEHIIKEILENWAKEKSAREVVEIFNKVGLPSGLVYTFADVVEDEHVKAREMQIKVSHPRTGDMIVTGNPIKMSDYPVQYYKACPDLGENNEEILTGLGYTMEQITELRIAEVIG